jgi:hypothetical protein
MFETWYKTKVRNKNKHGTKQRKEIKTNMVQNKDKK